MQSATPIKHEAFKFDCNICATSKLLKQQLTCPVCNFQTCTTCQKTYELPQCMNCKQFFTRTFLRQVMGRTYLDSIYRHFLEDEYMRSEKALLPQTQPFVIYEQRRKEELSKIRFGQKPELPAIPLSGHSQTIFPCPIENCRGYVQENNKCALCKEDVCRFCRKLKKNNHVCDIADMASVAFIHADTKECPNPNCRVPIQKSTGCDHMHCTHCRCHFKWESLEILTNSTNGHYRNSPNFAKNTVDAPSQPESAEVVNRECLQHDLEDLLKNSVDQAVLSESIQDTGLLASIYEDIDDIRCIKRHKYAERTLTEKHVDKMIRLRIEYLTKKITEEKWKKRVYDIKKQREKELAVQSIINVFLSTARMIQQNLRQTPERHQEIRNEWIGFIKMSNACLETITLDYGGNPIFFKVDIDNKELPSLSL